MNINKLPDFVLIQIANATDDDFLAVLIDCELEARYDAIREELEPYANELPF